MRGFRWSGLVLAGLASWVGQFAAAGEPVRMVVAGETFDIPEHNLVEQEPFWLRFVGRLAPGSGVLLVVSAAEMAAHVPGYRTHDGEVAATLYLDLEKLEGEELAAYLDPEMHVYSDVWYGREYLGGGRYRENPEDWTVEPYGDSGLFKVRFPGQERSRVGAEFWTAVRILPRSTERIPENPWDFYVGSCSTRPSLPRMASGFYDSCTTQVISGNWSIGFSVYGMNLHLIDEITAALWDLVDGWRVE